MAAIEKDRLPSAYPAAGVAWLTVGVLFILYIRSLADRYLIALLVEQTQACACQTTNPLGGTAKAGEPCSDYRACAMTCCDCSAVSKSFGAAVCAEGKCADQATACANVAGVSFAMSDVCK